MRSAPVALVLLLAAFVAVAAQALDFPRLTGRVVDGADILSTGTERDLTAALAAHETETSNQVVVVTLPSLQGTDIADFGYRLGREWGIGQKGRDNGVLLIVAPVERKVRIEVGYGLEGALTDATAKMIIERQIIPAFKGGDFDGGVRAGTQAILQAIKGEWTAGDKAVRPKDRPLNWLAVALMLPVVLFALFASFAAAHHDGSRYHLRQKRFHRRFGVWPGGGSRGGGFSGGGGGFGGGGSSGGW
ncbi:MAG: TPM domain-containing protein [Pseudomonadota bacterium]|nr:TPM domain-containing protein [Pseudomonadota bacterium]